MRLSPSDQPKLLELYDAMQVAAQNVLAGGRKLDLVRSAGFSGGLLATPLAGIMTTEERIVAAIHFVCSVISYRNRDGRIWIVELDEVSAKLDEVCPAVFVRRSFNGESKLWGNEFRGDDDALFSIFVSSKRGAEELLMRIAWNIRRDLPLTKAAREIAAACLSGAVKPTSKGSGKSETHRDTLFCAIAKRVGEATGLGVAHHRDTLRKGELPPVNPATIISGATLARRHYVQPKTVAKVLENKKKLLSQIADLETLLYYPEPLNALASMLTDAERPPDVADDLKSVIRFLTSPFS